MGLSLTPHTTTLSPVDECLTLRLSVALYTEEVIFRACHRFTDRCYIHLAPNGNGEIVIEFRARSDAGALTATIGEFQNELIDQRVRADIERETRRIREPTVPQAFAEGDINQEAVFIGPSKKEKRSKTGVGGSASERVPGTSHPKLNPRPDVRNNLKTPLLTSIHMS